MVRKWYENGTTHGKTWYGYGTKVYIYGTELVRYRYETVRNCT